MKLLLALLALACLGCAFPESPATCAPQWVTLAEGVRASYYGSAYVPGVSVTASQELYGDGCALGPDLLARARELTGQTWGFRVRIVDPATGRVLVCAVDDTGEPSLEVDLPDAAWLRLGYPETVGVIRVRLDVLCSSK